MTGRGAGYCAGYQVPGYMNPTPGYGFGMGFGRGRGRGFRRGGFWGRQNRPIVPFAAGPYPYNTTYAQPSLQEERAFLENQMNALQDQLDSIQQRLNEITAQAKQKEEEGNK
jgi:hypothetical protein